MFINTPQIILLLSICLISCVGNAKTNEMGAEWQALPENWQSLNYNEWLSKLRLTETCDLTPEGYAARFLQTIALNVDITLLLVACELGAYQDAYFIYQINTSKNKMRKLLVETPKERDGKWSFEVSPLVWGRIWKADNTAGTLEITYLSSASGMCGHRSLYLIDAFVASGVAKPDRAFGDSNCENGVRVEQWPRIK